jgi:hypothetical protein
MRRLLLGLAMGGLALAAFHRPLFADDPATPPPAAKPTADAARIKQLVDDLGSDDFHVREAASKELTELGEQARAALEAAKKSDVAEIRFRADQILRRLDGRRGERKVDDGTAGGTDPTGRRRFRRFPAFDPGAAGVDLEEMMRQYRESIDRLQREWENGGASGLDDLLRAFGQLRGHAPRSFRSEAGTLTVTSQGARLSVVDHASDGSNVTATYDAKDVDAILSAHPELKGRAGIADLVEKAKKAQEEAKAAPPASPFGPFGGNGNGLGGFSFHSSNEGLRVEVGPQGAKVTVTETGPDGKPVTKTYEGADLDAIKKEHPELANRIGGFSVHVGPVPPSVGTPKGDDDGEDDGDDDAARPATPQTGPFGLALKPGPNGIEVVAVRPGSDAAAAGLEVGDVITSVNGNPVTATTNLGPLVRDGRDSGSLSFDVLRKGESKKLLWKK